MSLIESNGAHTIGRTFVDNPALMLRAVGVAKTFTLHGQGGVQIDALDGVSLDVERGECVGMIVRNSFGGTSTYSTRCHRFASPTKTRTLRVKGEPLLP